MALRTNRGKDSNTPKRQIRVQWSFVDDRIFFMHYKVGAVYHVNRSYVIALPIKAIGNNSHLHKTLCRRERTGLDKALINKTETQIWLLIFSRRNLRPITEVGRNNCVRISVLFELRSVG